MLKNIPSILSPELLKILMEMGHGDEIVLADGNFPSASIANKLIRLDGHGVPEVLDAILKLFPLDQYEEKPVFFMQVVPDDNYNPTIWKDYKEIIGKYEENSSEKIKEIERFSFYEKAKKAYCVVATGETALYANIILKKGVVKENVAPTKTLYTGDKIPSIGIGTFGSDRFSHSEVANAVEGAIMGGYRHVDCASIYGNEKEIGESLKKVFNNGIKREDLWITSKVWNDMHGEGQVIESCKKTLKDLNLDYLNLYLVHWPFPNYHAEGCSVDSRNSQSKPYIHENFMGTWRQMEKLVEMGLVKNIGVSNMTIPKLKLLLKDANINPAVCEMELHPHFQQQELFDFCIENKIQPIGFCPIGSPTRPERDKTSEDTVDIEDPVINKIAKRLNVHPAVVCIKWAIQRGQIPIPFSVHEEEYMSNLKCTTTEPLTNEEMEEIKGIDKNCRLIKGQVFLWKENQDWKDLWDEDGEIAR